ncbi:MAG: TetR/AcrR family transcriptional regulator C-terminal domain-containing protein [Peptococcaceae bacterium]|nr:TetR/AcrR family transcriptional regulator C-terminal domain-containing protein [Peptococcaceae bacterium]
MREARESRGSVEELLAASLKKLTEKKAFAKITVKDITDAAELSRPTFYNHFQDKYELLEWIFVTDVVEPMQLLIENNMTMEAIILLFSNVQRESDFYQNVFQTDGQNSFGQIVQGNFQRVLQQIFESRINPAKVVKFWQTPENLAKYYSWVMRFAIFSWLEQAAPVSPREMAEILQILMTTSLEDIIDNLESI